MIKVTNYSDGQIVILNPTDVVSVKPSARGTAVLFLRHANNSLHVLESPAEVYELIQSHARIDRADDSTIEPEKQTPLQQLVQIALGCKVAGDFKICVDAKGNPVAENDDSRVGFLLFKLTVS